MKLPGITLLLKILGFIITSWILVHFLAVFGVFLAVSYPIWWLFAPEKTFCFFCRARNDGYFCPVCKRAVDRSTGIHIRSFRSIIINALVVLLLSAVSLGIVFLESKILFKMGFPPTPKTVSFVIPGNGQYLLGEIFPMDIDIHGIKNPINAVQTDFSFDPRIIEVVEISTEKSFANIFVQKEINNEVGYARLTGGLPYPGFFSDHGFFGTVYFKGKTSGITKVEFLPTSLVLANDGRGTNVLKDFNSASYLILPERLSPEQIEQQEAIIRPIVLGEQTEEDLSLSTSQMKFYQEPTILGEEIVKEVELKTSSLHKICDFLFSILEKIDRFILELWSKIFGIK